MVTFITIFYVVVCLFLILVVLLQAGKGGGMGALGGGSSQSVFGGSGAGNFMTRLTMVVAFLFMFLSGTLAYLSSSGDRSLDEASERLQALEAAREIDGEPAAETEPGEQSLVEGSVGAVADAGTADAALAAPSGETEVPAAVEVEAPEVEAPEVEAPEAMAEPTPTEVPEAPADDADLAPTP